MKKNKFDISVLVVEDELDVLISYIRPVEETESPVLVETLIEAEVI